MFKPVVQPTLLRSGLLVPSLKQPARNLKWEIKAPPVDTKKYLPKLKPSQLYIPVFVRRFPIEKPKEGCQVLPEDLTEYNWVYDRICHKKCPKAPDCVVILTKDVPGVGSIGTKLKMSGRRAYRDFILTQAAVYASPANDLKYKAVREEVSKTRPKFSSVSAEITVLKLQRIMLQLWMNMNSPWQVEKWHVRVAFRRMGITVPDESIELPSTPISGPDLDKEGKHFFLNVIINNHDRATVVCRLNHFSDNDDEAPPTIPLWTKPFDPLFEEDAEKLLSLKSPDDQGTSNPYITGFRPFTVIDD